MKANRWCDGCRDRVPEDDFADRFTNFCRSCIGDLAVKVKAAENRLADAGTLDFIPSTDAEANLHRQRMNGKQYG